MSNLENITQKILEDAKLKIKDIEEETEREIQAFKEPELSKARREAEEILKRGLDEAARTKSTIVNAATLSARDEKVATKVSILDEIYQEAKKRLGSMDDKEYEQFVNNKLESLDLKGSEELILQKGKTLTPKQDLKVSQETVDSGFAVRDGRVLYNFKFDDLVDYYRAETEGEVADALFGKGE